MKIVQWLQSERGGIWISDDWMEILRSLVTIGPVAAFGLLMSKVRGVGRMGRPRLAKDSGILEKLNSLPLTPEDIKHLDALDVDLDAVFQAYLSVLRLGSQPRFVVQPKKSMAGVTATGRTITIYVPIQTRALLGAGQWDA